MALGRVVGRRRQLHGHSSRPGEFVHRDSIARVLRSPAGGSEKRRSADIHACRIRKTLRDASARNLYVDAVYGRGYCLRAELTDSEPGNTCVRYALACATLARSLGAAGRSELRLRKIERVDGRNRRR
jgi:hypothetical protein